MKITNLSKIIPFLIILVSLIFLSDCANIQSPPGGPKDSIPPAIIEAHPEDMTRNFNASKIQLKFSEWPERNKVVQNISISPPADLTFEWSGTSLEVGFLDPLKENTTYSFLLGTEYTDLKGNKPDSAFSLTFSTGNVIDSGKIEGSIYGKNSAGAYIYAYRMDNKMIDTLNPENTPAEYKTQVGSNGSFSLKGLPDGKYRLMGIKTDFKDNLFHPASDMFGALTGDIEVVGSKAAQAKLQISKYPDFSANRILSESVSGSRTIVLKFAKPFVSRKEGFGISNFEIYDSSKFARAEIKAVYLDSTISQNLHITLADTIIKGNKYSFRILGDSAISDTAGIILNKFEYSFLLVNSHEAGTFRMNYEPVKDSSVDFRFQTKLIFGFNYPVKFDTTANYFTLKKTEEKSNIIIRIEQENINSLTIKPNEELLPDTWYELTLNQPAIESYSDNKLADSIRVIHFRTGDWRTWPKVSGKMLNKSNCSPIRLRLISVENNSFFEIVVEGSSDWEFPRVRPGKYIMETFCDVNKNGRYDFGKAYPFAFSEKFKSFSNVIEVKERWDVGNIMLLFDE